MTNAALDAFPRPSREDWLTLVQKTLKGGDPERLARVTADGVTIQPLYEGVSASPPLRRRERADPQRPWDVRTHVAHPDPKRANAQALADLEGGAASLLVSIDPTGHRGVAVGSADDLKRALDEVLLDLAPVALDARWSGPDAGRWLAEAAAGLPASPALHLDPLSAFAEDGASPGSMDAHLSAAADAAVEIGALLPQASLFLASGRVVHEAGGSDAQELGFALASALAYAKALDAAGMAPEQSFNRMVLGVSADAETMPTIAKLRAARLVWSRLTGACGAEALANVEARSSRRMLARVDPWTNMLRLTAAGFGAAVGGADSVVLGAFTDAIGAPTSFARRQARNTQLVLMEEAHLGFVTDPAAGAGLVEALTEGLARAGWAVFQAIEREGGAQRALENGWLAREVGRARASKKAEFARRKIGLVGVSEFPDLAEKPVEVEWVDPTTYTPRTSPAPLSGADSQCEALAPVRWAEPFEKLRDRAASQTARAGLATLGPLAEHAARVGFARALLAAGGISADELGPDAEAPELVILCGSDERYAAEAETVARALKSAGARRIWLAGRPGENETALRAAGIDRFVFAGGDAVEALEDALSTLEAARMSA